MPSENLRVDSLDYMLEYLSSNAFCSSLALVIMKYGCLDAVSSSLSVMATGPSLTRILLLFKALKALVAKFY